MLESIIKMGREHYPRTVLEEFKYEVKKKKMENFIYDNFDSSSSGKFDNESDNEESNGSDNEESND